MRLFIFVFVGLLFSIGNLSAQTNFRPGYVVSATGDTLHGEIDYRGDLLMGEVCRYRKNNNENEIKYYPSDILAYRFVDSKYFVSKDVNGVKAFLEFLIKGQVNIYYLRDANGDHYFLEKGGEPIVELPYEEGIKEVDNRQVFYETKKHIGLLSYYMQDAPELLTQIQSLKEPKHDNLIKLAKNYHNAVCEGEKCIVYEKSAPFIRINPEFVSGVIKFSNVDELTDKYYLHVGVIGHIWMPRTSENMYFRTGILYSKLDFEGEQKNFYKIPIQFEYIYPKGFIRPRVAFGLNFYIPNFQSFSFDVGANIKLSDKFFLSATSDIEFNPTMLIIPKQLLSHSLKLGLYLNF